MGVEAGGLSSLTVAGPTMACQGDEAEAIGRVLPAQAAGHFVTVQVGQADVHESHSGAGTLDKLQGGTAVRRRFHLIPLQFKEDLKRFPNVGVIFHNEDFAGGTPVRVRVGRKAGLDRHGGDRSAHIAAARNWPQDGAVASRNPWRIVVSHYMVIRTEKMAASAGRVSNGKIAASARRASAGPHAVFSHSESFDKQAGPFTLDE
jgi:hypothetical protein